MGQGLTHNVGVFCALYRPPLRIYDVNLLLVVLEHSIECISTSDLGDLIIYRLEKLIDLEWKGPSRELAYHHTAHTTL